jgi:hypothetical protein
MGEEVVGEAPAAAVGAEDAVVEEEDITRPRPTEKYWHDYDDWKVRADAQLFVETNSPTPRRLAPSAILHCVSVCLLTTPLRGSHSFTLELNLSNPRGHSWVELGDTVDRRAQVELKSEERV